MARSWTAVRPVEHEDWGQLHDLWSAAVADGPLAGDPAGRPVTRERLEQVLQRPGVFTYVAEQDERLTGFLVATTSPLSPLTDSASLTIELLYVVPGARTRGVGRLLLAKATLLSEQTGATHVVSNVPGQSRELNRFFARMGFTATVTRRITTPGALRRRLAGEDVRPFDRVLARRRSARARTGLTQPLEVVRPEGMPSAQRVS